MEQKINVSPEEIQNIVISESTPQTIKLKNLSLETVNINQNENQQININEEKNQLIYVNDENTPPLVTDVLVNGDSVIRDTIAYVVVPTKTSDLNNDSNFVKLNELSKVAISGNYSDLNGKPTIPTSTSELVNDSGFINKNVSDLTNYTLSSNLSDVATSGNYDDLLNRPTIPSSTSQLNNDSGYITNSVNDLINYTETSYFANVAFSGVYDDLTNLPTIPTTTSELTNDSGYITDSYHDSTKQDTLVSGTNIKTINNESILGSGNITVGGGTSTDVQINGTSITSNNVANIITESSYNSSTNKIATMSDLPTVPTKTSDLNNDSGFITNTVNDLTNYYTKTEIDNKTNYSTTEKVIGTWINGETLYRRVFDISNITSSNSNLVDLNSLNISVITKISGFIKDSYNNTFPIPLYDSSSNYNVLFYNGRYIRGRASLGTGGTISSAYAILEYTKTS